MSCANLASEVPKRSELNKLPRISASRLCTSAAFHAARENVVQYTTPSQRCSAKCFMRARFNMIALLRLGVQLLLKRFDQSLIICAYPEISIPSDRANLCWARSIVLFERSELLSVPRRNEKFHRKGLSVSYRIDGHMRERFSGQSMSMRSILELSRNKWTAAKHWSTLWGAVLRWRPQSLNKPRCSASR